MPLTGILDWNVNNGVWEPCRIEDSDGDDIAFPDAAVRHYADDTGELYHIDSDANIYEAETSDDDDEGAAIPFLYESKRFPLGAVSLIHSVYTRLEGATDSLTLRVTTGGAEYAQRSRDYTLSLAGTNDIELKTRIKRDQKGRWVQLRIFGDVSNRPALRELRVWHVPVRYGRLGA